MVRKFSKNARYREYTALCAESLARRSILDELFLWRFSWPQSKLKSSSGALATYPSLCCSSRSGHITAVGPKPSAPQARTRHRRTAGWRVRGGQGGGAAASVARAGRERAHRLRGAENAPGGPGPQTLASAGVPSGSLPAPSPAAANPHSHSGSGPESLLPSPHPSHRALCSPFLQPFGN